ncbi:MAG: amino acid adenylation domain-containing protein [Acidobacteria bacterium]|nr:amino acid adenylation domain-containing protein [Acidobacteriota bacterium]
MAVYTTPAILSLKDERQLLLNILRNVKDENFSGLSAEQHRLWLLRQLDAAVPTHVSLAVQVNGLLHLDLLAQSANEVIKRHEILRSTFVDLGKRPARIVAPSATVKLNIINAEEWSEEESRQQLCRVADRQSRELFDLRSAPLMRLTVIVHSDKRHTLLLVMHELVADALSLQIFIEELLQIYEARLTAPLSWLPLLPDDFGTLIQRENEWLKSTACDQQSRYWQQTLAEVPPLQLPTDFARPAIKTHNGAIESCHLKASTVTALEQIATNRNTTLEALFLAAFNTLLFWHSGQQDLAVGMEGERSRKQGLGPLTNTLVIRTNLGAAQTFLDVIDLVYQQVEAAQLRQHIPFAKLVTDLQPERDLSRTPLFQAKFVAGKQPFQDIKLQTLELRELDLPKGDGRFDLTLSVILADITRLTFHYNSDLFQPETVRRMLGHLQLILDKVAEEASQPLANLLILPEAECHQLALVWNQTEQPFAYDQCIHQLFEAQVARTPNAIAIACGEQQLTYRELSRQSDRLANRLKRCGIRPEARIGICLSRSPETVVAILAVLKAGAVYIPLDPEFPPERLAFILRDGKAQMVLARRERSNNLPNSVAEVLFLDDETDEQWEADNATPEQITSDNLAYIIYTSGSTGQPKGVAVTHQSVVNNLTWRQAMWPLFSTDRVLQNYSFTFDPSVWTTFWPLLNGACVILPRSEKYFDSRALARFLLEEGVTVYGAAPSLHAVLMDESSTLSGAALRYVFSGGESLEADLQERLHKTLNAQVYNVYGPTEATIDCTYWFSSRDEAAKRAPIGRPIANTQIYLLNKNFDLCPTGAPGEIFIAGLGLARGYVENPCLTAEKFLPNPFSLKPGARMYRTGDLGKQNSEGVLEFVGRADEQVKLRGFRIELGEIEGALLLHPAVREAAVSVTPTQSGEPSLTAYMSFEASESAPSPDELKAFLKQRLPVYMLPDLFIGLAALPRTANGKIDRRALPQPVETPADSASAVVAPRTPLEAEIAHIVGLVLGLDHVCVETDLFTLGCNSLLMARIASRLSNTYQMNMPVPQIFKDPTIAGLAKFIEQYLRTGQRGVVPPWTFEQLEAEAALDPALTAEGLPHADYCSPNNFFLTGVTGYLGVFLLEQLLLETNADAYCLVRANDVADGHRRIQETMAHYHIWNEAFRQRIHPVVGDLAKPLFGLSALEFAELAETVDVIYHCGALVNFVYPYSALKPANVQGTQEVIRLACSEKLKAIHYTSTVDVLLATHTQRPFLENDEPIINPAEIPDGYARSKWVSERLLLKARSRGVPVCVYRPGLVMGHTRTGATQTNDYLLVGLKGYIDLGVLPEPQIMIDFVSVDYVAKVMAYLSRQPASFGKYFHIWNPEPVHMSKSYEWIQSFGYGLKVVPRNVLLESISKVDASNAMYPFIAGFQMQEDDPPPAGGALSHSPSTIAAIDTYSECLNTFQGVAGSGIECPPLSEEMAHLCFSYLASIGFLPQPTN